MHLDPVLLDERVKQRFVQLQMEKRGSEERKDDESICAENNLVREMLFPSSSPSLFLPPKYAIWSDEQLRHVQLFLMEFSVRYRKDNGQPTAPGTMKGYLLGLQRFFASEWG